VQQLGPPSNIRNIFVQVPGIRFRALNEQWQSAVSVFISRVMQEVEPFLSRNGGPVIMGQIENELGSYGGAASQEYPFP
jgi:hypothetical protein